MKLNEGKPRVYIKNMVCNRCISAVAEIFTDLNIPVSNIQLGQVSLTGELTVDQLEELQAELAANGFELLDSKRKKLIDRIKTAVIELVHYKDESGQSRFSDFISVKLNRDYSYLSKLFSETEGVTIEKYLINQKIEKVKELLTYGEQNLSEIALDLGYSSVAHLSAQFKKTTGFSPTKFKQLPGNRRKTLDKV